ncbi:MAG TPA: 2OG-Fe(II) oxygenase [Myxococcota bacterium]|nr:2OG-Fe(II) oxygenase [Myxococcota bacterium]
MSEPWVVIPNLLSAAECSEQIQRAEAVGFEEAPINGYRGIVMRKDIRDNTRVMLDDPDRALWIWERLAPIFPPDLGVPGWRPVGLNERLRYYRYDPGQFFRPHTDGYFARENGERSFLTLLVYLNDDFVGGETCFPGAMIRPERGMALLFSHPVLHESRSIDRGRKYVLRTDVMFREEEEPL